MRGLSSRSFFARWQALYAASNPGRGRDRWTVDGVDWIQERHSYWGASYSFQFELHRLLRRSDGKTEWELLVAIERWWGPNRDKSMRDTYWCKALSGRTDQILAWMRKQEH